MHFLDVTLWFCWIRFNRWCHNLRHDCFCRILVASSRHCPTLIRFPLCPFPFRLPRFGLVDAAEISLQLGYDAEFAIANYPPPESQLRPLKSVPESVRKEIWDEARACEAVGFAGAAGGRHGCLVVARCDFGSGGRVVMAVHRQKFKIIPIIMNRIDAF